MHRSATLSVTPRLIVGQSGANRAYFFVRWSVYLYVFLMPLEHLDLFGFRGAITITKMAGVLVGLSALLQPSLCLARRPKAIWCFLAYMLVTMVAGLVLASEQSRMMFRQMWTLAQNLAMFWICYNLMRDEGLVKWTLLWFGAGTVALALFAFLGVSETVLETAAGQRVAALAENANMFGYLMALGTLSLMGLSLGRTGVKTIWMILLYVPIMLLIMYTIASGSRGSMLCLLVGIAVLLFRGGGIGTRLKTVLLIAAVLVGGARELLKSDLALQRWQSTLDTGELAGREKLMSECWKMFCERPIFGWGPFNHLYVLSERAQWEFEMADTHNDLLWVMTATGIVGTIPFVAGFGLCVWSAWRGRNTRQGYLPLVLILATITMSLGGTIQDRKVTWVVAAYAASAVTCIAPPTMTRALPRRRNRL